MPIDTIDYKKEMGSALKELKSVCVTPWQISKKRVLEILAKMERKLK